jgi:hypothetical protein
LTTCHFGVNDGEKAMHGSSIVIFRAFAFSTFLASGSLAAEGHSPDWKQVASADLSLMGDYEGRWFDAPEKQYFDINKPLAAQVINVREGEYLIQFFQQHDARADTYFVGTGRLADGVIRFEGNGWRGEVSKDGISGRGSGHGGEARFELKRVVRSSPSLGMKAPEGAIVLFDGKNFDEWQHADGGAVSWHLVEGGAMEVRSAANDEEKAKKIGGDIITKRKFGSCRVHLEFRYPVEPGKAGQGRGNSGFFLQDCYEVQVLNSYGTQGLWNECGALYKTAPPKVNAARPPMEWQTYDIDYTAAVWKNGEKISPPRITVRLNGVVIHRDEPIPHATAHAFDQRLNEPREKGPLKLQDHGNAIQYRNIWIVPGK